MRQRTVTMEQVQGTLEQWIQAASHGETVLITRGGLPVAALVRPPRPGLDPELASLLGWEDGEEMLRVLGE